MFTRALPLVVLVASFGCTEENAPNAQRVLLAERVPRVKEILRADREKHWSGIQKAAQILQRGMGVEDPDSREAQYRTAMRRLQEPPRGVAEFIASPMSFLAVIGEDGVVIARDTAQEDDLMKGDDFGERFESVQSALNGEVAFELAEFEPLPEEGEEEATGESSFSMMYAAPMYRGEEVVGAAVLGIPLWREAQRLSRQLRVELAPQIEEGMVVWVYLYKGDQVFHYDTPPELDEHVPDAATRNAGLETSPGGFTGHIRMHGLAYGYAVVPTPTLGEDVGMIVFQSEKGAAAAE